MITFAGKMNRDEFFRWLNPEGVTLDEKYRRKRLLAECAEVDEELWDCFLGVLPPMNWTSSGFAISEATSADLRLGFFRLQNRYFAAYVSDYDPTRKMAATRALVQQVVP